jgi:FAD-linked sulfhydryl oxidase
MSFIEKTKKLDANVWGKHYWFFLHTVAYKYPETPNAVTKRKYYDLIINFPLFIPDEEMGDRFAGFLDKYPVTPYLDNRDSFIHWCWFIHNKMNRYLDKEEITLYESIDRYLDSYKPVTKTFFENALQTIQSWIYTRKNVFFIVVFIVLLVFILSMKRLRKID